MQLSGCEQERAEEAKFGFESVCCSIGFLELSRKLTSMNSSTRHDMTRSSSQFTTGLQVIFVWTALLTMISFAVSTSAVAADSASEKSATKKPNIVFFFIDDLGWTDVGFMGSDNHETPNIDRLASEGLVFTDAYACAPNCAPSRACLMSGQYTPRHGIYTVGDP